MVEAGGGVGGEGTQAAAESARHRGVKNENIERTDCEMMPNTVSLDAQGKPPSNDAPSDGVQRAAAKVFNHFR